MSKSPVIAAAGCRRYDPWLGAALWVLAALPIPAAGASPPEPALRSSESLDLRRLGSVSDDQRSVLRVEWRAAQTRNEEAGAVQRMLDSLRRMETAAAEIRHLIAGIPTQRPALAAVAAESAEVSSLGGKGWAPAMATAAVLLSLWWLRRRNSVRQPVAAAAANTVAREASAPVVSSAPHETAQAPPRESGGVDGSETIQLPAASVPATDAYSQTLRLEPRTAAELFAAPPAPTAQPDAAATAAPMPSQATPGAFSLEDADAEFIARQNARIPVPRKPDSRRRFPERRQELHIEPTLQLAEIMLSMGLQQGAARSLVEYIDANPRQAVYHWLKLLSIYRDAGQRQDFVETAAKLRMYFNIQAADAATADTGAAPTLESFPRVADQVGALWSQPKECISYLQHLLEDNREGSRIGFPQSVAEELLLLIEILKDVSGAGQAAAR